FKSLDSGWSVSFPEDDIIQKGDKLYYKAVAVAKRESDGTIEKAIGWAREEDVPIFHTQKGDVKQMQDPQWTGAVGSYARKYALQGLF
ncbi:ERF family protein, partial [Streptococcus pneumoniae]|nr:ERF family protein [Streptococcus pneumoniae]